jgi:hypothetical protein
MSSIQSFLRQRNVANTIYTAPTTSGCYYVFVAGSGNYVGNYPPGYMVVVSGVPEGKGTLIRDMGKTIKAPIADAVTGVLGVNATSGFFREIQFIDPQPAVGPTGSTTFGVGTGSLGAGSLPSAGNAGDAGYGTYYLAIVVDGTLATSAGTAGSIATVASPYLFGGQM